MAVHVSPRSRVNTNWVIVARGVCVNSSSVCSHLPRFVLTMHIAATAIWLGFTRFTVTCDSPHPRVAVPARRYCSATISLSGLASVSSTAICACGFTASTKPRQAKINPRSSSSSRDLHICLEPLRREFGEVGAPVDHYRLAVETVAAIERRQAKYSPRTFTPLSLTIGTAFVLSYSMCSICGAASVNAGHLDTPVPLGFPVFAKFVQYVRIVSDRASSLGVGAGRLCSLS